MSSGTDLAIPIQGGEPIANLQNLRTEIVLRDANDVAFWFSFSFRVAMDRQQNLGKRALSPNHQIPARQTALFPIWRGHGREIISGEDGSKQ